MAFKPYTFYNSLHGAYYEVVVYAILSIFLP